MYLRAILWVLVVILAVCFQCAISHVLQRRMEGFLPYLAKKGRGVLKNIGNSSDNPPPTEADKFHSRGSSGGQPRLKRLHGQRFDPKLADNVVAQVEQLKLDQEIDAILARSHYVQPGPVPESLERYVVNPGYDEFDTWEERFGFEEYVAETVNPDPIYLDVLHADPKKVPPQKEVDEAYSRIQEAGRLLTKLTPEQRIQRPIDVKFMVQEFQNTWLKHIPPDKQTPEVLAKIKDVSERIRPMVVASKKHAQVEAVIAEPLANWKKFDGTLGQGLQDALTIYAKDQTGKAVASQVMNHFKTWHSSEIQQTAKSTAEHLLKDLPPEDIVRMHSMVFSSRQYRPISVGSQRSELQQFLAKKLGQVPHERDEEYQFILERLSTKHYINLRRKSNMEITTLTPEQIAAGIKIGTDDMMHLKFHFAIVNPTEQVAESILKTKLDFLSRDVAADPKVMKAAYQQKVYDIVYHTNRKVETQLFKKNFGMEVSSGELAQKINDLGQAWNPDLKAFETDFKNKLPEEEYAQLSQAAAVSKELYAATLESIKEARKLDRFEFLESRAFDEGHKYSYTDVLDFVHDLEDKGVIDRKLAESLFESGESSHEITSGPSGEAAATALNKLHQELQIDLFDKLEIRSIPQLDLSPATSAITKFLDELTAAKLITPEERRYFYPLHQGSTPISLVEDFAANTGRIADFSHFFQTRLQERLSANFDQIPRDAPSFRSGFLTKSTESEITRQKDEINEFLDKNEYAKVFERLRPQSIDKNVHDYWSNEYVSQELWDDYFSREYIMYKMYPIDQQMVHMAQNQKLPPPGAQELKDLALSKLSPPDPASSSAKRVAASKNNEVERVAASSSSTLKFKNKKTEFPDDRHFALVRHPLKPMKGNDATQTPPLADARFQNTAFRYLDKHLMDEWNSSVEMIASKKERYQQDIIKRDLYVSRIQKTMQSEALQPYSGIIGKIFAQINSRFSFGFSRQGKVLYKLTPAADDPRVQEAFRVGHRL
ncbi:hypothetical protein VP01_609g6 [Puccinia sorghi]|uniref:Uncharacterized protein n=1 Tax=Puccinia sorghi TaxID=27349 RepID=A0A0L6UH57_9BASI|nr:hypothetical protein VP01_609g6 [Puccinia sorghi]